MNNTHLPISCQMLVSHAICSDNQHIEHRKTQMSHLTHLSQSGSLHGQKTHFYIFLSHFVRVLTHYGSNDSFGFFCEPTTAQIQINADKCGLPELKHLV